MRVDVFIEALKNKGIQLTEEQVAQFERYYQELVEWNEKVNLTAITVKEEVYLKHFYDSLMPLWLTPEVFEKANSLCDVGAGAGFPSIPLKIVRPDLTITIIDSLNKRIQFLDHLSGVLGLSDVSAVHARAEEAGQNATYRGQFDIVTARAVASLNVLTELCIPLARKGGHFIALKGQQAEEELKEAQGAIRQLGAKYISSDSESLPGEEGQRTIITIRKTLDTPNKYPRRPGKPGKQPLK
ncbi:16S rRNA (guanine(527)-N(7))-methyltransferase RsmG [Suicoccus acidiformans]|uniref:Ribosomal RNA small subunit methyltransferase G n=1 Tax=Suicoccus acidiformans TaxID=2036206 RepID=A0A347WHJ6_9LACT|nr:16S rRNA (guanine(527)-N(7))-methyltransferase RsmG [Suicoccus acidiformans]AXY24553.1 16S rRNA (guanine(527)-N(7))-methyltransferase RsmG [Suicoccus acidiformans]